MRRYLLLILCLSFALSSLMGQSSVLPNKANDDISVIVNDSLMFIGQNVDSLTEEQRYFNPLYLIVQKGKEYLKKQLIRASVCDCDTTVPNRRIGIFSVAPNKHVSFSQGNLQYFPAANLWKFADNQYEYLGASNKYLSPTYRNWVDLFGWSGEGSNAPFGVSTSTNHADYAGEFLDWGTNPICGDAANIWRTLSKNEWNYLLNDRKNATSLIGIANINGINGLVILPDNWTCPAGVTFKSGFHSSCGVDYYAAYQTFTADQWSKLEKSGAIFLPAAGYRRGSDVYDVQNYGSYWATEYNGYQANDLDFLSCVARMDTTSRYCGQSVRLVHDTIVPTPAPCETFTVNGVSFNMMCVEGGTFTMGEGSQAKQVNVSDYMIGQTEVTQALWKVVMGTTPENEYNSSTSGDALMQVGDNLPMAYLSWNDAQKFVERLNAMTGLYFRLPTEAEWIYAAKGGQRSKGYKYSGSDSLEEVAWCATNAKGEIKPVGLLKPNELGIYDMCGNVWEFCNDVQSDGKIVAHGCSSSESWSAAHYRPEYRYLLAKTYKANRLGLRLVMDTAKYIPTPCETFEVNGVKFNMMCVEGGTMTIGAGDIMEYRRRPEHKTTISDFYIGQTQVTQELWQAVMGDNPSVFKSDTSSSHPVENVSVIDIQEFLTKLNAMTGVNFRLPTEAEWEYAARGGQKSKGFMYAGSDDCNQVAWYGVSDNNGGTTHPVAQKCPNELGIYDMHGNVWEWLHDRYADTINIYPSVNPTGFISNLKASPVACGSAYYSDLGPSNAWGWVGVGSISTRSSWFGFRLALSDKDPFMAIDVNNYRFHMMLVKGGTFQMGAASTDATALENERPAHQVTLPDYYAGQTEVTRALWKTVMGSLPDGGEADNKPITNVNYDECQTFITQLNDLTGRHFRLPTEAEWEFAARGGNQSKGYKYAGSNDVDSVAWWQETSGDTIHPVAQLMPNELGIYDMSGNVFEWCSDWYGDYASNAQINPQGAASGTQRVGRGGGYRAEDNRCRVTRRIPTDPEQRMTTLGLRLVLDKHAYVDLGLSVLWATTNLGATQPEEYGDYFAWGETEPKDSYTRDNYKWRDNTKYNNSGGLTSIQLEDDAAHVNWGGEWRMPTKEEYSELIEKCTWTWTQHKGINGYQVTGPNGNSIFLPATGYIGNGPSYPAGEYGLYWTTELNSSSINFSYMLIFGKNYTQRLRADGNRVYGFSIRPVIPTNREPLHPLSPAKRIGVFSIAKDKQVSFSQGNLQYIQSDNLWRFADNQYDYIGEDNIKDNQLANRIDLFGWSSNSSKVSWGISISDSIKDYMGDFVDWGVNIIHSDAVNTWRTLNHEEWKYLFCTRLHAQSLFGFGKVADVNGIIFCLMIGNFQQE